ncbi:MAG: beta strand repeat-containing protein [Burkholderiales bacterium]
MPIARPGPQSITIDDGDRLQVIGRGGTAMIESAADQFIALRGTGANQIVLGAANAAGSALIQASGSQFASAGSRGQRGGVTLVGGVAEGTSASIRTIGPLGSQNVSTSGTISAVGGSAIGSEGPSASADAGIRHEGAGPQVISAESIVLRGGTGGGTDNDGFIASIEGAQFINAGVGGITLVGGSGGDGNDAHITQFGIASPQTITVATGGSIVLQGGSSPGFGKRAAITAFGPSQLIEFVDPGSGQASAAGVSTPSGDASLAAASATRSRVSAPGGGIVVIGGSVGAANEATIVSDGTQTITGSPDLTLTGGASGGQRGSGNAATIRSSVSQDFTLGTVHLSGGAGGIDNYASIEAPIQSISTQGALTLIGSSGGSGFSGARIGGLADGRTALALSVGGALILSGGAASDGESALGASALSFTAQDAGISIFAEGDVTLNGGSAAGSRIGQPAGLLGSGDIAIASGGNIVLGGGASAASAIRTSGEVTLVADSPGKSISQAANSSIVANTLTASADSGVNLSGANQVGAFVIASGGDVMYNSAGSLILDADSSITTPAGVQAVTITTSGGASDIVLTGNFDGSGDNYAFASGRDILFGAGTTFGAGGLTLAGAGRARFPSGTVTLNTPLTANVPLELSGATVNFNAATVANAGLALSAGTLQGSGDVSVTGGVFQWSGGVVSGPANFTTASATNVTGPVLLDARTWNNASAVSLTGPARIDFTGNAVINNQGPGAWDLASSDATAMAGSARFNNAGTLSNSAGAISRTIAVQLTNTGRIDVDAGTLVLTDFPTNAGTVALNSGATLSTNGAPLANFGLISGTGTVDLGGASGGTLTNNGTVAPETLVIDGNFVQSSAGTLAIEIGGTTPGVTHDVLQVNGNANLGGTLLVNYVGGFAPAVGDAFNFLTYASGSGDFSTFVFPPGASALPGTAGLTEYQLALNPLLPDPTLVRTGLFERTANEILRDQVRMTRAVTEELVETAQAELQATEQQREGLSRTAVRQCN